MLFKNKSSTHHFVQKNAEKLNPSQVQKLGLQAAQKTARISAAGYFYITRNTITRVTFPHVMSHMYITIKVYKDKDEANDISLGVWNEPSLHLPLGEV